MTVLMIVWHISLVVMVVITMSLLLLLLLLMWTSVLLQTLNIVNHHIPYRKYASVVYMNSDTELI